MKQLFLQRINVCVQTNSGHFKNSLQLCNSGAIKLCRHLSYYMYVFDIMFIGTLVYLHNHLS